MRIVPLCVLFIILSSLTLAQSEKLPDVLIPDAAAEADAQRMGANVFKLVPRGTFPDPPDPNHNYRDEDNPIGIRFGGSSFSFSTGLHSYNKIPEIRLEKGELYGVFAGYDLGFLVDLGARDLREIEASPEAKYVLSYKPPKYEKDLRREQGEVRVRRVEQPALNLRWSYPAITGDTYLLRSISWNHADTAVAFRVLKIDEDGSVTIVWKSLGQFPKPFYLFMPDDELRDRVNDIIAEEKLSDVEITVKDNWLYVQGSPESFNKLHSALNKSEIRYRGETRQVR